MTDGPTDGQTSCHGIVRAMHTRRAVKTVVECFGNLVDWFEGYARYKQHALYITTNSDYGSRPPNVHTMQTMFFDRPQKFTNVSGVITESHCHCDLRHMFVVPFNPLLGTLKIRIATGYRNTVIGTLTVKGWVVTFGTVRRGLGGLRPRLVPCSLYQI